MDEMNKDTEPGTTDQKQSEKDAESRSDIKIWQKPQTGKKKRYVYEVVTGESGENSTVEPLDEYFTEKQPGPEPETKSESDQSDGSLNMPEGEFRSDKKPEQNDYSYQEGSEAAGEQTSSGNNRKKKAEDSASGRKSRKKVSAARRGSRKKTGNEGPAEEGEKQENLLEKDNISKKARQEFWKKQVVEGTSGQSSALRELLSGFRRQYKRIISIVLVLAVVFGTCWLYDRNRRYHDFDVEWQVPASESSYSEYLAFHDMILHYSQDGVSCMNQNGEVMWSQAFNMDVPGIAVAGDYAVIYDIKGTSLYICSKDGCTGHAETKKGILKADISETGIIAVVLDDKTSNYINYFRKDGSQIDLEIKTLISGDGYPLDIAISPNGEQLITSYVYADSGKMMNQVVFRNFEVGKNNADRVVGGFRQYKETLVPEVIFFDDQNSAAITEQSIDFYSTRNAMSPELSQTQKFDSRIRTVFYNKEYVGVVLEEDEKKAETGGKEETQKVEASVEEETAEEETKQVVETSYTMLVFDKTGGKTFEQTIDFEYEYADFSGDGIVAYSNSECAVYNMTGVCKYQARLDMNIEGVMRFAENSLVIYGNGALQKLSLK